MLLPLRPSLDTVLHMRESSSNLGCRFKSIKAIVLIQSLIFVHAEVNSVAKNTIVS